MNDNGKSARWGDYLARTCGCLIVNGVAISFGVGVVTVASWVACP